MSSKGEGNTSNKPHFSLHLSLTGLLVFVVSLALTASVLTWLIVSTHIPTASGKAHISVNTSETDSPPAVTPPWGELITRDIDLSQPEEYLAFEMDTNRVEKWSFEGRSPDQVRQVLASIGFASEQISTLLASAEVSSGNVVLKPEDNFILALPGAVRARLYVELSRSGSNHYMQFPFRFPGNTLDARFAASDVPKPIADLVRQLCYQRGDALCFSDYEVILHRVSSDQQRMELVKVLSRQPAVLARIRVRPDTDIDKILGYWDRGMQVKDVRPLLESLKQSEGGGSISIIYLLPQFARQRLYTSPVPDKGGDPLMDCHWTTMNFFNDVPDNRFSDPAFTAPYLSTNYYRVAKPTAYGDVIVLLDQNGKGIHSAVFLADDLVFTKNGNNFSHPWMLMRIKDLLGMYASDAAPQLIVYRNKNW